MRTVVFGGAAASSIKRNNPRAFHFSVERMTKASEKRRLQLEATLSSDIVKLSYTKAEIMQDLCHYAAQPDIPPDIAAILSGPRSEAKHLMPAKSSPRSELAMALAKWRQLAPEFCARAHLSQSNAEDPFDEMVSQQPSTLERRAAARARLKSQGKVVGLHSRLCERTLGPTPSTEDSAEALKKWLEGHRSVAPAVRGEGGKAFEAAHEYVAKSMSSEIADLGSDVNVQVMRRIVRLLKSSSELKTRGREAQMQAGRTFRRAAEIENLIKERMAKKNVVCNDSPWHDPGLEPPPASIGNAFAWRRPVAPVAAATGTSVDFQQPSNVNAAEKVAAASMNDGLNGNLRLRRVQIC